MGRSGPVWPAQLGHRGAHLGLQLGGPGHRRSQRFQERGRRPGAGAAITARGVWHPAGQLDQRRDDRCFPDRHGGGAGAAGSALRRCAADAADHSPDHLPGHLAAARSGGL